MAKQLKTFQTSIGFFDLAIAAPSMKAALEAWGADSNLFHQNFAWQVDDPAIVAATLKHPGVVLRRPVGSKGAFTDHADLPSNLTSQASSPAKRKAPPPAKKPAPKTDAKQARKAAAAYEREQQQRDAEQRRDEARQARERERRDAAIAKATGALQQAEQHHSEMARAIDDEREAVEARADAEAKRWQAQQAKLKAALRQARES